MLRGDRLPGAGRPMGDYTPYQKKVIRRYYDNAKAIGYQRLTELVSEIYLAEGKRLDSLWKQVETALGKLELPESRVRHVLQKRDPQLLASLVQELCGR
jgi:hypothetical protein